MNALWFNSQLLYQRGTTPTRDLVPDGEHGLGFPPRILTFDQVGDPNAAIYRGSKDKPRVYAVTFSIKPDPSTKAGLDSEIAQWEGWHKRSIGEAVVKRLTENNNTYCLDAVARDPQWGRQSGFSTQVTQEYEAGSPYWRDESETSANEDYNGAGPETLSVENAGDVPAWVRFEIEGIVNTPRISLGSYYVEVNVNMTHANDLLEIRCKPPATIYYTPNGGSRTAYFGYRESGSELSRMQAEVGSNSYSLTATSGTATCTAYWYNLYGSLE